MDASMNVSHDELPLRESLKREGNAGMAPFRRGRCAGADVDDGSTSGSNGFDLQPALPMKYADIRVEANSGNPAFRKRQTDGSVVCMRRSAMGLLHCFVARIEDDGVGTFFDLMSLRRRNSMQPRQAARGRAPTDEAVEVDVW